MLDAPIPTSTLAPANRYLAAGPLRANRRDGIAGHRSSRGVDLDGV